MRTASRAALVFAPTATIAGMTLSSADSVRAARQLIETNALLGVDFVPVARTSAPAAPAAQPAASDNAGESGGGEGSKAERLAALRERYEREAEILARIEGWTNIVFSDGDPDARLMFIGEAPGADEDAQGLPFVGRAGKKLNEMITAMGLSRETVYIANVLKVRPPGNRTPTLEEAALDGPWLARQVEIVQPEVIVTLGKSAAQFLLSSDAAMGALRGSWHEYQGVPVMPTYHPAYLLRSYTPENRKKVWSDLQQVMARLGLR